MDVATAAGSTVSIVVAMTVLGNAIALVTKLVGSAGIGATNSTVVVGKIGPAPAKESGISGSAVWSRAKSLG